MGKLDYIDTFAFFKTVLVKFEIFSEKLQYLGKYTELKS